MPRPIDIAALRREAEGEPTDIVPVSRRWLRAVLSQLERPVLDHDAFSAVDGHGMPLSRVA